MEFTFGLDDRFSDPLRKLDARLGKFQGNLGKAQQTAAGLASRGTKPAADGVDRLGASLTRAEKQLGAVDVALGTFVANLGTAAVSGLERLAKGFLSATIEARELYKVIERKLTISFGGSKAAAEEEIAMIQRISKVSKKTQAELTDEFIKLKSTGLDRRAIENVLTIAEDASQIGDQAGRAVVEAYAAAEKSKRSLINPLGAFDATSFDKLVESGAIDRKEFLVALAKERKTTERGAQALLEQGLIRANEGSNLLTKQLKGRFDAGKNIGSGALDAASKSLPQQLKNLQENFLQLLQGTDTSPLLVALSKLNAFLSDPGKAKAFGDAMSSAFTAASRALDAVMGFFQGTTGQAVIRIYVAYFSEFGKVLGRVYEAAQFLVVPAFERFVAALDPLVGKLGGGAFPALKLLEGGLTLVVVAITAAIEAATWFITKLTGVIDIGQKVYAMGANFVDGFVSGIRDGFARAEQAIDDLGTTVLDKVASVFKIRSPSKVMMQLGGYVSEGFALGVGNGPTPQLPPVSLAGVTGGSASRAARSGMGDINITVNVGSGADAGQVHAAAQHVGDAVRAAVLNVFQDLANEMTVT